MAYQSLQYDKLTTPHFLFINPRRGVGRESVILMDQQPNIDGIKLDLTNEEFFNYARLILEDPPRRVIFLTGKAGTGKRYRSHQEGSFSDTLESHRQFRSPEASFDEYHGERCEVQ